MRNTLVRSAGAAGIALMALAGPALADGYGGAAPAPAEEGRKFGYSWTVTGASDYMFRGISYTQNDPTINSYLEATWGIAYLGFWTSNIDYAPDLGPWEQDIYLGIRPVTGRVNWDLAVLWYLYGTKNGFNVGDYDVVEFKAAASTSPFTNFTIGVTGYYTPDQDRAIVETYTVEGNAAYTLPKLGMFTPTISGIVGLWSAERNSIYSTGYFFKNDGSAQDDLVYWNAGLKLGVEKVTLDFRYWDTDLDSKIADERFVFSAIFAIHP
jgi:uncharacterized protein (TIGR02001 family)